MSGAFTGGCQCGAVRYRLETAPKSTFCHCRMCQRATGGVFAALSMVKKSELSWTRGAPATYASSNVAERGFCASCGTPLTFAYADKDTIEVTTGSLDDPEAAPVSEHFGVESRLSWLQLCDGLPEHRTGEASDSPSRRPDFRSNQGGRE
jgi:hypothetical protein